MYSSDIRKTNIFVGVLLFGLTILGHFFTDSNILASLMWPAFGVSAIYYYYFDKKVLPGIILGIFAGQFFYQILLEDGTQVIDIIMRFGFVLTTIVEIIIFKYIVKLFQLKSFHMIQILSIFILSGLVSTFVGGLFNASILYLLFQGDLDFLYFTFRWMIGDLSGLILFGSIVYLALLNKEKVIITPRRIVFNSLYFLFCLLIFLNVFSALNYEDYNYLFIIFFVLSAFLFNYSNLFILAIGFLISYQFLYVRFTLTNYDIDKISIQLLDLNIFLAVLVILSLVIKYYYDYNKKNTKIITENNTRLEGMLDTVNSFFSIGDQLFSNQKSLNVKYLKEMFKIATTIYDKFDGASCYIKTSKNVHFIETIGYDTKALNDYNIDASKFSLDTKKALYLIEKSSTNINKLKADKYLFKISQIRESLCIGIQMDKGIVGGITLDLHKNSDRNYEKSDKESLQSFQTYMNSFYEKSKMIADNQSLKNDLVLSLVRTLELYDEYTYGHSMQVAEFSQEIGKKMGLSEKKVADLFWAGICHDIGKVGVRRSVINKESKLTEDEYAEVKMHSNYAYDVLIKSKDLEHIAIMVRHHHEWYDGSGYPDGLLGNSIPIESQILLVADSVSSMVTSRPYNIVKTEKEVLKELERCSGTQFNPKIANCMIELITKGILRDSAER